MIRFLRTHKVPAILDRMDAQESIFSVETLCHVTLHLLVRSNEVKDLLTPKKGQIWIEFEEDDGKLE